MNGQRRGLRRTALIHLPLTGPPPLCSHSKPLLGHPSEPRPGHITHLRQLPPLDNLPSDDTRDLPIHDHLQLLHPPEPAPHQPPDQRRAHQPLQTPQNPTNQHLHLLPLRPAHPQDLRPTAAEPGPKHPPRRPVHVDFLQPRARRPPEPIRSRKRGTTTPQRRPHPGLRLPPRAAHRLHLRPRPPLPRPQTRNAHLLPGRRQLQHRVGGRRLADRGRFAQHLERGGRDRSLARHAGDGDLSDRAAGAGEEEGGQYGVAEVGGRGEGAGGAGDVVSPCEFRVWW